MAEEETFGFISVEQEDNLGFTSLDDEPIAGITDIEGGVNVGLQTHPSVPVDSVQQEYTVSTQQQRDRWTIDGKMGWWEYASRTKGKDIYYGDIIDTTGLTLLTNRLKKNEYKTEDARVSDTEKLTEWMLEQEEFAFRGMTIGAGIYRVTAQIPSFALEMAATGGLASATRKGVTKTATILGKKVATEMAEGIAKKSLKTLGREAVVAVARTTVMPHRYISKYKERQLNDVISITDKGVSILDESEEKPMTAFIKAYGDTFIEYYTETLGGEFLRPIGKAGVKNILSKIPKGARASFVKFANALSKKIPKGRVVDMVAKGGFDGIIEEYGEERLGQLFRATFGLDERDIPTLDKFTEVLFPGWEQAAIEIGAFSIWGGSSLAAQKTYDFYSARGKKNSEIKVILDNLSETEKEEFTRQIAGGEELSKDQLDYIEVISTVREAFSKFPEETRDKIKEDIKNTIINKEVLTLEIDGKPFLQIDATGKTPTTTVLTGGGIVTLGGKTFEEEQERSALLVKALAGEELNEEEREELELIHKEIIGEKKEEDKIPESQIAVANEIVEASKKEPAKTTIDEQKKIDLLYQGREKQLDQRRIAIEKQLLLNEKLLKERKDQNKKTEAIQNKLDKLSKELESIHFQIADLEDTGITRLEKEGILIGGKDLESLRKKAFRQGEIQLRKDLLKKQKERKKEKEKRTKAKKIILKQPKKPSSVIDIKSQKRIENILNKLGEKTKERIKTLNSLSTENLERVANIVAQAGAEGRKVFKNKKEQREIASDILEAVLVKNAGGIPFDLPPIGSKQEKKSKKATKTQKSRIAFMRPLRAIREVFKDLGVKIFYDSIDAADTQANLMRFERQGRIQEAMKKHGVTSFGLGDSVEIDGISFQVNNVLAMRMAMKNKEAKDALINGNNISEDQINAFIEKVEQEFPGYIEFADEVQPIVAERYPELSNVMESIFNKKFKMINFYFPIRRVGVHKSQDELNQGIESELIFEAAIREGTGFSYTSTEKNFTIDRETIKKEFQTAISLDFIGDAIRAIDTQEHFIAFSPLQKAFNKTVNNQAIKQAVEINHTEDMWKAFNEYLDVVINPSLMFMETGNMMERAVNKLLKKPRRGLSKAFLGFNAVTSLKQLPSSVLALKFTNPKQLAVSLQQVSMSKEYREEIYKKNPSLRNRVISRDFQELVQSIKELPEGDIKRALQDASLKVDKVAFTMLLNMDKLAVLAVYDAVYRHQRQTKSEAESKDIANKAVIETQPQGGVKDLPAIYRTNKEYLRMVLMFTNQLNQIWQMMSVDMPAELKNKEYKKAAVGIASVIISSTLIYVMSNGRLPDEPDEFFDAIFGSFLSSVPIVGNWGMSWFRGYDPSVSPATSITNNIKWMINNIKNENYVKASEQALFLVAIYAEMPFSQIKRTTTGAYDLISGQTTDLRRLIWSEAVLED